MLKNPDEPFSEGNRVSRGWIVGRGFRRVLRSLGEGGNPPSFSPRLESTLSLNLYLSLSPALEKPNPEKDKEKEERERLDFSAGQRRGGPVLRRPGEGGNPARS
jgi:hypothetical protein